MAQKETHGKTGRRKIVDKDEPLSIITIQVNFSVGLESSPVLTRLTTQDSVVPQLWTR